MESCDSARIDIDLSDDERSFLLEGVGQWGGPGACTEELARAMGFAGVEDLVAEIPRLVQALIARALLARLDWTRVLICAEVNFASDVFGAGVEWASVTPFDDEQSVALLRRIQRKLVGVVSPDLVGRRPKSG